MHEAGQAVGVDGLPVGKPGLGVAGLDPAAAAIDRLRESGALEDALVAAGVKPQVWRAFAHRLGCDAQDITFQDLALIPIFEFEKCMASPIPEETSVSRPFSSIERSRLRLLRRTVRIVIGLTPGDAHSTPHSNPSTPGDAQSTLHSKPMTPDDAQSTPHSKPMTPDDSQSTLHSLHLVQHSKLFPQHASDVSPSDTPRAPPPTLATPSDVDAALESINHLFFKEFGKADANTFTSEQDSVDENSHTCPHREKLAGTQRTSTLDLEVLRQQSVQRTLEEILDCLRSTRLSYFAGACHAESTHERVVQSPSVSRSAFPDVHVSVKVYQLANVDTAMMSFNVDFVCRLDWCDPLLEHLTCEQLESLDWSQHFNPDVDLDNGRDGSCWLDGADAIPRRPELAQAGPWLRKTKRFRGTLAMGAVNLKCFPFDIQVLPLRLKASRGRGDRGHGSRVPLVSSEPVMRSMEYLELPRSLRGCGQQVRPSAAETMPEFHLRAVTGTRPLRERPDVYEVRILVERPIFQNYFWEMVVMNVLVGLAASAFWDTASSDLSSRMSISLTVILTVAACTATRPAAIEKAPYVTFHDWTELITMLLVAGISLQNIWAVVNCGGQDSNAPPHMREMFERNSAYCEPAWCHARSIDCQGLLTLLLTWSGLALYSFIWVVVARRRTLSAHVLESFDRARLEGRDDVLVSTFDFGFSLSRFLQCVLPWGSSKHSRELSEHPIPERPRLAELDDHDSNRSAAAQKSPICVGTPVLYHRDAAM